MGHRPSPQRYSPLAALRDFENVTWCRQQWKLCAWLQLWHVAWGVVHHKSMHVAEGEGRGRLGLSDHLGAWSPGA